MAAGKAAREPLPGWDCGGVFGPSLSHFLLQEHGFVRKFEPRPGWPALLGAAAATVLLCVLRQLR